MPLEKIQVTEKVSLLISEDHQDYIEIFDDFNGPVIYDDHTGTFDIKVCDIQEVIDFLEDAKERVSQIYMMRGIM